MLSSTFVEFLLQRRESVSYVLTYCCNIHKFFGIVVLPPSIKTVGAVVGRLKSEWSKLGEINIILSYLLKVKIFIIVDGAKAQLAFLFEE